MTDSVERGRRGAGIHRGSPTTGPAAPYRPDQQGQSDDTVVGVLDRDGGGPTGQPSGPPDDDALMRELAAAGRRRYWNKLTVYLGAVVLLVCGIVIGVQVQKSYGTSTPAVPAAGARGGGGFAGGPGGAQGGAGQPGGQPGSATAAGSTAGKATTGTVKLVDGTTVYLQTDDGSVLTVKTGANTAVQIAKAGSLKDLKAGDKVTVEGTDSAGTVTATSVTGQPK